MLRLRRHRERHQLPGRSWGGDHDTDHIGASAAGHRRRDKQTSDDTYHRSRPRHHTAYHRVALVNRPPPTTASVDYGQQYLELIAPLNCAGEALGSRLADVDSLFPNGFVDSDWPAVKDPLTSAWRDYASIAASTVEAYVAADWPDDLQPDIDSLIAELSAVAGHADAYARTATFENWVAALDQPAPPFSAATVVRAKLGLESNIGMEVTC